VFDMGQNLVGWARLKMRGPPNSLVKLRYAEVLNDDGTLYTDNLRGAPATDFYALRGGGLETFEPHFTYHGFRYVEVTGLVAPPDLEDLTCKVVCTGAREVGRFECSDPTLTRLWQNIRWSLRGNLMSVPTDCPQRDERLGWMGDMNAFAETAVHEMDLAAFFTKWLQDVRDAQADDGRFPDFAPHPFDRNKRFTGSPGWADAGVHVPWVAYETYGDKRVLEQSYASVMRWIEHVRAKNPDLVWANDRGNDYGDWLNGGDLEHKGWSTESCSVPKNLLATAFFARSAREAAKMAEVLGRADDARKMNELADAIQAAFVKTFVADDGTVQGDTQAGYALALSFDLLPKEKRAVALQRLSSDVGEKRGNHLTTGFQSTGVAMCELARHPETAELASRVARETSFPSWGYAIAHGATTIWERRDAYVEGRGFQDASMNSFNHFAFGSVGEYLMGWVGGIQPDASAPGYARFAIHPRPGTITSAHAEYDSIRGTIASNWKLDGDAFRLDATIPANTQAKVYLPTSDRESIKVDGRALEDAKPHVSFVSLENGEAVLDVHAGTYAFECTRPRP
jgi:alpha-L-rhamnosidase